MGSKITDDILGIDPPALPEPPPPPPPPILDSKPVEEAGKKTRNRAPPLVGSFFSRGVRGIESPVGSLSAKTLLGK